MNQYCYLNLNLGIIIEIRKNLSDLVYRFIDLK